MRYLLVFILFSISNLTAQTIRINEVVSSNSQHTDVDGDTPDWLELHNYGTQNISINNWALTDDEDDLTQWTFPNITLAPDQYLLIWASKKDRSSAANDLHTNFKISSSSETLILTNTSGTIVDQITAENLSPDTSLGISKNSGNLVVYLETTPGNENSNTEYQGNIQSEVVFSQEGGLVNGPLSLVLSGNTSGEEIRYTIGGSMPTETSTLYTGPIQINTSSSVKAQIFAANYIPSSVYTKSYILNANHEIDVILLTADSADFFDENTGIYVFGPNDPGPFPYRGANFWKDWERPIHFAFYENGENTSVEFNAGVKIFGGWSRANNQRSLSLFARSQYGDSKFEHSFFDELNYNDFEALVLRNSGQDWLRSSMKDIALSSLMRGSGLDFQEHTPVATYLNGEYWGMYNLREKVNEHMLASKHNIDADDIILLDDDAVEDESNPEYNQLINYLSTTDLTIDSNFEYVTQVVDIEEYVLYHATEIFFNNSDWPGNNIKFWKHPDGKWRWVMFDTDNGFRAWSGNALARALADNGPVHPNPPESTLPFRRLVTNIGFRNSFINRYADELNTRFLPNKVKAHIDEIHSTIQPEINAHYQRWGVDPAQAILYMDEMKTFADNRPTVAKNNIRSNFNLPGYHPITITNPEISEGFVAVNSNINIQDTSWTGDYFETVPIQLKAIPLAGFEFSHWSGDIASTDETISITLIGDLEVTPNFSPTNSNDPIVINEINYKSSDSFDADDWVELYNPNESSIDLSDWQLKDDNDSNSFTFPAGTTIDAGGYIVIVKTASDFSSVYPEITNFIGDIDFGFGTSDAVRLFDANNSLQDEVSYQSATPWSNCADETGNTLQLISPDLDNSMPDSWSCINTNGSPNAANDSGATADAGSDQNIMLPTDSAIFNGLGNDPDGGAIVSYAWTQEPGGASTATLSGENTTQLTATNLVEGTYVFRLTVTDDEDDTGFDLVSVTVTPETSDMIWLEAECAIVGADWNVVNNGSASNGQHTLSPIGNNLAGPPTDTDQMLTFDFQADAGAYSVHALVQASTGADDSFWVRSNGGTWIRWNKVTNSPTFVWDQVHDSDNGSQAVTFNLVQGTNTVDIALREDGASVDKIYITSTSNLPTGLGEMASNCVVVSEPPTANAGGDQNIMLPIDSAVFNGTGNDPDGGAIVSYAWTQEPGGASTATLSGENTTQLTATNLVEGTYVFRLTVTDDEDDTGFDLVSVTVAGIELLPPTADAGSDQNIMLPTDSAIFNGSGNDPDGGAIVSYAWTQEPGGASTATLSGENTTQLTATNLVEGTYVFRLTVTDDEDDTGFDLVSVTVTPETSDMIWLEAECAIVGADWNVVNNGSASNGQHTLSPIGNNLAGPPTNTDQMLTFDFQADAGAYSVHALVQASTGADDSFWVRSNGGTWIRWNKVTNSPTFVWDQVHDSDNGSQAVTFNLVQGTNTVDIALREDGASVDKIYITSTSNLPTGLGEMASNCVVVSEPPTANAGGDQNIMLPIDSAVFNGSGNDPDGGAIVSYAWTQEPGGASTATLSGENTTQLTATNLVEGTYVFRLTVTDNEGDTGFDLVSVTVAGIELLPPTADAGSDQNIMLPTDSAIFNGSGNDPDGGAIVSYAWTQEPGGASTATLSGENTTQLTATNLVEGTYVFRLTVTDDEDDTGFDLVSVTVTPETSDMIWLEAECAIVGANWSFINDGSASNGQYVLTPSGNNLFALPTNSDEYVTFSFQADAGSYSVHALVQASTGSDDSFWVRSNGGTWIRWNKITNSPTFVWDQVHDSDNGSQAVTFNLVQGINTIDIALREDGAALDKIYITSTGIAPSGLGGTDSSCAAGGNLSARSINQSTLSPNPAIASTTLSFEEPVALSTIQVFDVMGRLIQTYEGVEASTEGSYLLNVNAIPAGTYFIKSMDANGVLHQKKMVIIK